MPRNCKEIGPTGYLNYSSIVDGESLKAQPGSFAQALKNTSSTTAIAAAIEEAAKIESVPSLAAEKIPSTTSVAATAGEAMEIDSTPSRVLHNIVPIFSAPIGIEATAANGIEANGRIGDALSLIVQEVLSAAFEITGIHDTDEKPDETKATEKIDYGPSLADEIYRKVTGQMRSEADRKVCAKYPNLHMLSDAYFREKAKNMDLGEERKQLEEEVKVGWATTEKQQGMIEKLQRKVKQQYRSLKDQQGTKKQQRKIKDQEAVIEYQQYVMKKQEGKINELVKEIDLMFDRCECR